MNYFRNSRGQVFSSGLGGTYPVNNGDPQCDDDQFDQDEAERFYEEQQEQIADDLEQKALYDD